MTACSAPWYELNLSAPDSNVSACCYYGGQRDMWLDGPVDVFHYWNGPGLREVRRLQAGVAVPPNGCSSCFFFEQMEEGKEYYSFGELPPGLSAAQSANWLKAKAEFAAKTEQVTCTPLRVYANFGYTCNLSCTMCHQVPRRGTLKRQIEADTLLSWHSTLESALEICVIGGEPFSMPESIKFVRAFAPDERYEAVRLTVFTNGTVVHKHWRTLLQKQRLTLGISLDSIGEGYEKIRAGGLWADVERNLLTAVEAKATTHPEWLIHTNASLQKTALPYLPQFARWHVKHGVPTMFADFISSPGVEDTYYTDNVLQNPQLLDDIPRWQDWLDEASSVFRSAGRLVEAEGLDRYRRRVTASAEEKADHIGRMRRQRNRNDWSPLDVKDGVHNWAEDLQPTSLDDVPVATVEVDGMTAFAKSRMGDYFNTPFRKIYVPEGGGQFRVRAHWPKSAKPDAYRRLAHVVVQHEFFGQLEDFREYRDFGFGTELAITGALPNWCRSIRVMVTPLGEDLTFFPVTIEVDIDPDTATASKDRYRRAELEVKRIVSEAKRHFRRLTGRVG